MDLIQTDVNRVVVGLGLTGLSTMRYLQRRGLSFVAVDTREEVENIELIGKQFPGVKIVLGEAATDVVDRADEIYLSPGLPISHPMLETARARGCSITGDLDLFSEEVEQPVIAITGTNGKSTVTELVGEFAKESGLRTAVAGNIGTPMLDVISPEYECYVLELSSFQLERASKFKPQVGCILNVSADHIDHHGGMLQYQQAKQRIYQGANIAVFNRDDNLTAPLGRENLAEVSFGLKALSPSDYGLAELDGQEYLVKGTKPVIATDDIRLHGRHNAVNVMAAIAIGEAANFSMDAMLRVARRFSGLAHRCCEVARQNGVVFIDDSKATNEGATLAAVEGLKPQLKGKLLLIAGGQSKGAEFASLAQAFSDIDYCLILIGEDAPLIKQVFAKSEKSNNEIFDADSMQQAVDIALENSTDGDIVLLSPACASFDMFSNYRDRGNAFAKALEYRGLPVEWRAEL